MPPQTDTSPSPGWYQKFKNAVKKMKREVLAVYYAIQDPAVGYLPRAGAGVALAYALSPLDLIPDFIPILGLIDDLLILPALLWLAVYLIPAHVMDHARQRAINEPLRLANNWIAAALFFLIWDFCFGCIALLLIEKFGNENVQDAQWWIVGGGVAVAFVAESIWAVLQIRSEKKRKETTAAPAVAAGELPSGVNEPLLQAVMDEP